MVWINRILHRPRRAELEAALAERDAENDRSPRIRLLQGSGGECVAAGWEFDDHGAVLEADRADGYVHRLRAGG